MPCNKPEFLLADLSGEPQRPLNVTRVLPGEITIALSHIIGSFAFPRYTQVLDSVNAVISCQVE